MSDATILAQEMLEAEIMRMIISPPGQAAMSVGDGNDAHINTYGRIIGGATGAGIFYPSGTGTPTTGPPVPPRVTGTPPLAPSGTYDDSYKAVFGVSYSELKSLANSYVTNAADFPDEVPTNTIIVCEVPSIKFDAARPLTGTGLVVIKGNVSILPGSNSVFNGFLYVEGGFDMRAPAEINGAVVITDNMTLQGIGDYATISYDEDVLNSLRTAIGNYRLFGSIRPVITHE